MATYRLSEADYLSAGWLAMRRRVLLLGSIFSAIILALAWHEYSADQAGSCLLLLLLIPFFWALLLGSRLLRMKRHYRQSATISEEVTIHPSAGGFTIRTARGTAELRWSDFHKWRRNPRWLLLYPTDAIYYMIPLCSLTPDELRLFEEGLSRNGRIR